MVYYLVDSRGSTHHHRWFAIHYYDQAPSSQLLYTFHGKDDVHMPSICCNFVDLHHLHHICICCEKHIIQMHLRLFCLRGILIPPIRYTANTNTVCIVIIWCCCSSIEGAFDRDLFGGGGVKKLRLRIFGLFFRFMHLSDEHPQWAPHDE